MKRINDYQKFRDEQVNEEWNIMAALRSATGAFKGFLTGLAAPFKNISADFKKGLKREELKKKVTVMLDTLLKTTTDSINKAEDEAALTSIATGFTKEFDDKCVEIDKEIQAVKESNSTLILEGAIKDGMIAGRVMLGMVKQKAAELKMEFDKKVATAKDLAGKKAARIAEVKAIVDDFKKKVTDDKYLDEQIAKYKTDNKIEGGAEAKGGNIILDWGDVEIELYRLRPENNYGKQGFFKIAKSGSKKLIVGEDDVILAKVPSVIKKGEKVKLTEIRRNGELDPMKEYETGALERIVNEKGEEVDTIELSTVKADGQVDVQNNLKEIKTKNPARIADIKTFTDFVKKADDAKLKAMMDNVKKEMGEQ